MDDAAQDQLIRVFGDVAKSSRGASDCQGGTRSCTDADAQFMEDPYLAEVRGEHVRVRLCEACWSERNAEI